MRIPPIAFIDAAFSALTGHATPERRMANIARIKKEVAEALRVYGDQLVAGDEPHALLSAQPRRADKLSRVKPYTIATVDERMLEHPTYSLSKGRPLQKRLAHSALKIPAGTHDVVIAGGAVRPCFTTIRGTTFEAGKRYAIFESTSVDANVSIFIAEYQPDSRFKPGESEFYIRSERVSSIVYRGSGSPIRPTEKHSRKFAFASLRLF